jgi:phage shock protein PspC (stress-responsive transcriptional regulator)
MSDTTTRPTAAERLVRPRGGRVVAGVAEALGRHLDLDPTFVRILFVATSFLGGLGIVAYAAAWVLMPDERAGGRVADRTMRWMACGLAALILLASVEVVAYSIWLDPWGWSGVPVWTLAASPLGIGAIAVLLSLLGW